MANDFDDEIQYNDLLKKDGERIKAALSVKDKEYQSARHLCMSTGLDIDKVLGWVEFYGLDREVLSEQVGSVQVYFLPQFEPVGKLYNGGDGSFKVRELEPAAIDEKAPKIGDRVVLRNLNSKIDGKKIEPAAVSENYRGIVFDYEEIESLAAINPNLTFISEEIGESVSALTAAFQTHPKFANAMENGRKIYMQKQQKMKTKVIDAPAPATPTDETKLPLKDRLTPAMMEDAAFNGISTAKLGEKLGVNGKHIDALLYNPKTGKDLYLGWKKGKERLAAKKGQPAAEVVEETKSAPADQKPVQENLSDLAEKLTNEIAAADQPAVPIGEKIPFENSEIESQFEPLDEMNAAKSPKSYAFNGTEHDAICGWQEPSQVSIGVDFGMPLDLVEKIEGVKAESDEIATLVDDQKLEIVGRPVYSAESAELAKNKFYDNLPKIPELTYGGPAKAPGLNVEFTGDFFSLNKSRRLLLGQMADLRDAFEAFGDEANG